MQQGLPQVSSAAGNEDPHEGSLPEQQMQRGDACFADRPEDTGLANHKEGWALGFQAPRTVQPSL